MRRKIFKKIFAGFLTTAMVATSLYLPPQEIIAAEAGEGNPLRMWYDESAMKGTNILSAGSGYDATTNYWQQQTLPIGNGDMGANIYGEIESEHLTFNEKTLWKGGPSESRPNYMGGNLTGKGNNGQTMKDIAQMFMEGKNAEASAACGNLVGTDQGYGSYQPWGDIYFDYKNVTETNTTEYQRDLDLSTAISTVSFKEDNTTHTREYFISHDDNVFVAKLTAEGNEKLNLDVRFVSKQGGTTEVVGNNTLKLCGEVSDNQLKYASFLKVVNEGGTLTGADGKINVADANSITVYLSAATDYKNVFWNEDETDDYYYRTGETAEALQTRVEKEVDDAITKGYAAIKADHLTDYKELFDRVVLDLGQGVSEKTTDQLLAAYKGGTASVEEQRQLETMLFQYGRYLTIASSREDSQLPSNLQGVWNCLTNPPWSSDYHMNVNLQMNYWPTYSTNLAECAIPLIDYIDSLREPGRITAAVYAGVTSQAGEANGFMAHTQNTPFGWTCPGWSFDWGWSPAAVPWMLQNCWEYFEYTGDVEFMEDYIYPMLKEEAILYNQMLVRTDDGQLVSSPSYSPEHGPRTAGNTYEHSLIWQLYEDACIAAEILGVDEDLVEVWRANQADLKGPIEVGEDGQLKEWYEETTFGSVAGADMAGHRHLSHMLGLFPGDLVQQKEEWVEAARVAMDYRTDNSTGWAMGQRINTWARLGDGNKAHELIRNLFKGGIYPNLWDSHSPFQIDGNFGMTSGVAEMLMQSNMGYINLLPALSDEWANGSVEGLIARGNFEIDMKWKDTILEEAVITSNLGGEAIVKCDNAQYAVVTDSDGQEIETEVTTDGKIIFDTVAGKSYTISEVYNELPPSNIKAERMSDANVTVSWDAQEGEGYTYNVYRQVKDGDIQKVAEGITGTSFTDNTAFEELGNIYYQVSFVKDGKESTISDKVKVVESKLATAGKVDDQDSKVVYSSGWGNWNSDKENYNGTVKFINSPTGTETATLEFYGTGIEVISCKQSDRGHLEITIDDMEPMIADTYNATQQRQAVVFSKKDLPAGKHVIVVRAANTKGQGSSTKVELDGFEIFDDTFVAVEEVNVVSTSGITTVAADNSTLQLAAEIVPADAGDKKVTWSTSDATIATVKDGLVQFKDQNGTVTITATSANGISGTIDLKMTKPGTFYNATIVDPGKGIASGQGNGTMEDIPEGMVFTEGHGWYCWSEDGVNNRTKIEANGDAPGSTSAGKTFTYTFTGTGIGMYVHKVSDCGGFKIELDGEPFMNGNSEVWSLSGSNQKNVLLFEILDLENTEHTLEFTSVAIGNNKKVNVDYFKVYTPAATVTVDRAELQNYILGIQGLQEVNFDPVKWADFAEAMEQALAAINNDDVEQSDLDTALENLTTAYEALGTANPPVITENMTGVCILKESSASVIKWDAVPGADYYKVAVVENGQEVVVVGEVVATTCRIENIAGANVSAFRVYAVNEGGESEEAIVIANSVDGEVVETVNKTALTQLVSEAEATYKAEDYTEESFAAYQTALDTAKATLDKTDATQDEVDAAKTELEAAISDLDPVDDGSGEGGGTEDGGDDNQGGNVEAQHTPSKDWSKDATHHWHACTFEGCTENQKHDLAAHKWDAGKVTKQPTATAKGEKTFTCTICGATKKDDVAATGTAGGNNNPQGGNDSAVQEQQKVEQEKTEINSLKTQGASLKADEYTADSWNTYQAALNKVNTLISGGKATSAELNQAKVELKTALGALVKAPATSTPGEKPVEVVKPGVTFKSGTYQFKIISATEAQFTGVATSIKTVKIANTIKYGGKTLKVTSIAKNALKGDKVVTKVVLGSNIKNIGNSAFENCIKLTSVNLKNVTKIGNKAFKKCTSLKKVTIPKKVTNLGKSVFEGCKKLSAITIKATGLKRVGKNTFKSISAKAKIKVPKKNLAKYKKLLKNKGQGKKVTIK